MKRPKLIRDWEGGYVKILKEVSNYNGSMPAGTIFKVKRSGKTAYFESLPCKCCGFKFSYNCKTKYKFNDVEWLGYDFPGRDKKLIELLKNGKLIAATKKFREYEDSTLREALDYCRNLQKIYRI